MPFSVACLHTQPLSAVALMLSVVTSVSLLRYSSLLLIYLFSRLHTWAHFRTGSNPAPFLLRIIRSPSLRPLFACHIPVTSFSSCYIIIIFIVGSPAKWYESGGADVSAKCEVGHCQRAVFSADFLFITLRCASSHLLCVCFIDYFHKFTLWILCLWNDAPKYLPSFFPFQASLIYYCKCVWG